MEYDIDVENLKARSLLRYVEQQKKEYHSGRLSTEQIEMLKSKISSFDFDKKTMPQLVMATIIEEVKKNAASGPDSTRVLASLTLKLAIAYQQANLGGIDVDEFCQELGLLVLLRAKERTRDEGR